MSILSETQFVSHSPCPPLLMLPAPKVAGLLGAGPLPNSSPASEHGANSTFTFSNWRLATLDAEQHHKFADAAQTLLDVALRFTTEEMNEDALRAAQVLFHRKLTGHSPKRPMTPVAFRAEGDADLLDVLLTHEKRRAEQDETFERRWAERMAARWNRKAVGHD